MPPHQLRVNVGKELGRFPEYGVLAIIFIVLIVMLVYMGTAGYPNDCVQGSLGLVTRLPFHLKNNLVIIDTGLEITCR